MHLMSTYASAKFLRSLSLTQEKIWLESMDSLWMDNFPSSFSLWNTHERSKRSPGLTKWWQTCSGRATKAICLAEIDRPFARSPAEARPRSYGYFSVKWCEDELSLIYFLVVALVNCAWMGLVVGSERARGAFDCVGRWAVCGGMGCLVAFCLAWGTDE